MRVSLKLWASMAAALAAVAIAVVSLASGGGDETTTSASGNAADAAFIAEMTAHHQGAVEMARIAEERAEHPETRQLANEIVAAQEGEIATMRHIAEHGDAHAAGSGGHIGMSDAEMGMDMDPATLKDAEPFDRAFIDMMTPHHEGAVAMAKQLLEDGEHGNLRKMAEDIIAAQTKEIAQMHQWRTAWYGSAAGTGDAIAAHVTGMGD
jgi:uncharacterized protein (DUF305 family)